MCERSDDGCHLGFSVSRVIKGFRYQWWLENRSIEAVRAANSLVDWLDEKITDPATFEWGWDRVRFFGPQRKVRAKEKASQWQQRVDATLPNLKALVTSRAREIYTVAGSTKIPLQMEHGTKRKFKEIEDEEEEPSFSKWEIWSDQVQMTRKYLTENHKQMRKQGVDSSYFLTYRTYGW